MTEKTMAARIRAQSDHSAALLRAQILLEQAGNQEAAQTVLALFTASEEKWKTLVREDLDQDMNDNKNSETA